jgi:hypothetical protein
MQKYRKKEKFGAFQITKDLYKKTPNGPFDITYKCSFGVGAFSSDGVNLIEDINLSIYGGDRDNVGHLGDWVVKSPNGGYNIYSDKEFHEIFEAVEPELIIEDKAKKSFNYIAALAKDEERISELEKEVKKLKDEIAWRTVSENSRLGRISEQAEQIKELESFKQELTLWVKMKISGTLKEFAARFAEETEENDF